MTATALEIYAILKLQTTTLISYTHFTNYHIHWGHLSQRVHFSLYHLAAKMSILYSIILSLMREFCLISAHQHWHPSHFDFVQQPNNGI